MIQMSQIRVRITGEFVRNCKSLGTTVKLRIKEMYKHLDDDLDYYYRSIY